MTVRVGERCFAHRRALSINCAARNQTSRRRGAPTLHSLADGFCMIAASALLPAYGKWTQREM
jgi:hypothetical protein